MAINSLVTAQKWVELATSSPTSGTTVTFSSLTQYKDYKVSYFNCNASDAANLLLRFNNDSGNSYCYIASKDAGISSDGLNSSIILGTVSAGGSSSAQSGVITILDANQLIKTINFFHTGPDDANIGQGFWNSQSVIDRIDLVLDSNSWTGGTIKVYGRN